MAVYTLHAGCTVVDGADVSHTCHARDCTTPIAPELLMDAHHWRMVPRSIQSAVYKAYRHGQCDDMKPSAAWSGCGHCSNRLRRAP